MSGFFFFFVFFSLVSSLSRKNLFLFSPSSLSSSFLSSSFSGVLSFLGEKKKRKNISLERSARFRSEREKNIRTTTYAREVQKGRKLSPLLLLPSLFLSLLLFVSRRGTKCVISLFYKKRVMEYFRDDPTRERPKRERSEEK